MSAPVFKADGKYFYAQVSVGIGIHSAMEACMALVEVMNGRQLSYAMADNFEQMARDIREKIEAELQRDKDQVK